MKNHPIPTNVDVSVIVVTYNQEGTIARTLDSILSQRFDGKFEIVIGDDASSDATPSICRDYAERFPDKIHFLERKKNLGVCRNYFDCIAQSRGKYLADCAGDDFWVNPQKLQMQFDTLEADPEVSMVVTDWLACRPDGSEPHRYPRHRHPDHRSEFLPDELMLPLLKGQVILHLCSAMFRRDALLDAMKGAETVFVSKDYACEDLQIQMAMIRMGKIVMLPDVTMYYSVGDDSISHPSDARKRFDYVIAESRQLLTLMQHFGIDIAELAPSWLVRLKFLASLALKAHSRSRRHTLLQFLKHLPSGMPSSPKLIIYRALLHL